MLFRLFFDSCFAVFGLRARRGAAPHRNTPFWGISTARPAPCLSSVAAMATLHGFFLGWAALPAADHRTHLLAR